MSEKKFNSRVIHKHDTEVNWSKSSFIPLQGEVVIFDIDDNYSYERIKVGDGVQNVNALPFVTDALETSTNSQITIVSQAVLNVASLVGDTPVSEQISDALSNNQSDWNQNDNTQVDYIKNRTHYTEEYTLIENFSFEGRNGWLDIEDDYFYADRVYNVTFDGVSYECVPYFCDWQGFLAIGNQIQTGKSGIEDNGMNFYATLYNYTLDIYAYENPNETHTITITSTKAKTIDTIYLEGGMTKGTAAYSEVFNGMPRSCANGVYSHAEGEWTIANGDASHTEGGWNIADGDYSHAEGDLTVAYGDESHAEGRMTAAIGLAAHSEGQGWYEDIKITGAAGSSTYTVTYGQEDVHVGCTIKNQDVVAVITSYDLDTATIKVSRTLSKNVALNETNVRIITYGIASGDASHVEGSHNIATGNVSHVEGSYNVANRANMHVSGTYNTYDTESKYGIRTTEYKSSYISVPRQYSFKYEFDKTTGYFTLIDPITTSENPPVGSYVMGYFDTNGEETSIDYILGPSDDGSANRFHVKSLTREDAYKCKGDYVHVVGNGEDENNRSNAHTLDWSGNAWFSGTVKVGGTSQDDENAKELATEDYVNNAVANIDMNYIKTVNGVEPDENGNVEIEMPEFGGNVDLGVTGATVGQVVAVKSVDEIGKPVAWECVDIPEHVQSDWNQNDSNASDYIKNRTHYQEIEEIEWIPSGTYNFIQGRSAYIEFNSVGLSPTPVTAGTRYKVTLDGVVKEYIAIQESNEVSTFASFGETTIGEAKGNGASGFVAIGGIVYLPLAQAGEHTLEITYYNNEPTYHKLDENFIPTMQDEEVVTMLVNKGFVDPVTDNSGDILTNANGDILIL